MVSNLLSEMQSCPKVEFQLNEQYGEDLSEDAWQYIFAIDLLCSHLKWDWTHDNVIRYCGKQFFKQFVQPVFFSVWLVLFCFCLLVVLLIFFFQNKHQILFVT